MYQMHVDPGNNRLYVTFKGQICSRLVENYYEELKEALKKLKSGFISILNISEVERIKDEARDSLTHVMKLSHEAGIGQSIHITPSSLHGHSMAYMLDKKSASVGYLGKVVHSLEEAEQVLSLFPTKR